ncbi:MAG: xanthine dehydrogenase family protein molybdopterin-binding subunit [Alphaproteobacteria bacterium]|nr:xanthine dehydrogenase family protein molybdopterin-binding subunit [Alphaproteobacteria bacterium]
MAGTLEAVQRERVHGPVHGFDPGNRSVHQLQRRHFARRQPANRLFRRQLPEFGHGTLPSQQRYYSPKGGAGNVAGRREDARFVTGRGRYLDDIEVPGALWAAFLRSPHAHARIRAVEGNGGQVFTAADIAGLEGLQPYQPANMQTGEPFDCEPHPLLAQDRARYAGQAVAFVTGRTPDEAQDAADRVRIVYEALDPEPERVCLDWRTGDAEAVEAAFSRAAHRTGIALLNHRVVINPMEPRGAAGSYDPADGRYTLRLSSQNLHVNRDHVAACLGVEPERVRFIAEDVGGGFGVKNFAYPEHPLLLWAARRLGRPVRWTASRSEVFLSDHQCRGQRAEAELALDGEGRFLALRISSTANAGAWFGNVAGGVQTGQFVHLAGSVYAIPAVALHIRAVLTHTPPEGVTRGPGFAEMVNILERLIDKAAAETGIGREELRRRNLVSRLPMTNALGFKVDSGAFREGFALAERSAGGFAARRRESEAAGLLRGLGFACHIKATGGFPEENVELRFHGDGRVDLVTGTQHIGQGHETTFPEIAARCLDLPGSCIRLVQGDTDEIAMGGGHGSSRATYMAGTAIFRASEIVIEKGRTLAANRLEAAEADIEYEAGEFRVAGTDRAVSLFELADEGALDTYYHWAREWMTFPNGTHLAEVEIDPETGAVRLVRYAAFDDYGEHIDDAIVTGQVHGAIAQGVGQALLEEAVFEPETVQPITGSFMDYAMPRADDLPSFDVAFTPTRCTTNPLGVKGCGEAGAIAGYPAVTNAILDALAPLGVRGFEGAATPFRIWKAVREAAENGC